MAKTPYHDYNLRETPQSEAIDGTVPNSAGGYSYQVDAWTRLHRFLILGTEGGSYYSTERALTRENAKAVAKCLEKDYVKAVNMIVNVSVEGRNAKHQPVIFALAMAAGHDAPEVRRYALSVLPEVCRTGTHLFLFASYIEQFRGWGRGLRDAISNWYLTRPLEDLEIQVAKYRQREGWSHRDLLRLAKPQFWMPDQVTPQQDAILRWAAGREYDDNAIPSFLTAVDQTQRGENVIELIGDYRALSWEMIGTEQLAKPEIWQALLPNLPMGALVRNLGRMTANGALKPMSVHTSHVVSRLTDETAVKRSRIHPFNVLLANLTYKEGRGLRGKGSWTPITKITEALDDTFRMAFANVEPANKRTLVALDVSGSMSSRIMGSPISAREAAAAMALITVATEPQVQTMAFDHQFRKLDISAKDSLESVVRKTSRMNFGATDCAKPMLHALKHRWEVDTFIVYTDSETWYGNIHPYQALVKYREAMGIPARLVVVGMVANDFSIANPTDAGMLDVVGFDSAAPALISNFSAGRI